MTITPARIIVFALGQEQLYRRSVFGQGQFEAQLVPGLPVLS